MWTSSKGSDLSYVTLNFLVTSKILSVESQMNVFASKAVPKKCERGTACTKAGKKAGKKKKRKKKLDRTKHTVFGGAELWPYWKIKSRKNSKFFSSVELIGNVNFHPKWKSDFQGSWTELDWKSQKTPKPKKTQKGNYLPKHIEVWIWSLHPKGNHSKLVSMQCGCAFTHLFSPQYQPSSPIPGSSLSSGPTSYKQTNCPKTQQWGTCALPRLSARALLNATFWFSAAQDVHFL